MLAPNRKHRALAATVVMTCLLFAAGCVDVLIPDAKVIFIAFGDSSTDGPTDRDYADILREMLGQPPGTFANEGQSGEETDEGADRLRDLLDMDIYPNAEVLLYWEGANDLADWVGHRDSLLVFDPNSTAYPFADGMADKLDDIQENIETAIGLATDAGLDVYVATSIPIREELSLCQAGSLLIATPIQAAHANAYIELLNERIRQAASNEGATLVELTGVGEQLATDAANFHDCTHLSAAGNEVVAGVFYNTLVAHGH